MCSGVHPSSSLWWIFAPWWTSSLTHSRFPDRTASWMAAIPTYRRRKGYYTTATPVVGRARQPDGDRFPHRRGRWCPGWLSWLGWNVQSSPAPRVSRSPGKLCHWGSARSGRTSERLSACSWMGRHSPGRKSGSASPGRRGTDNTSSWSNLNVVLEEMKGQMISLQLPCPPGRSGCRVVSSVEVLLKVGPPPILFIPSVGLFLVATPACGRWVTLHSHPLFVTSLCLSSLPQTWQPVTSAWSYWHMLGRLTLKVRSDTPGRVSRGEDSRKDRTGYERFTAAVTALT